MRDASVAGQLVFSIRFVGCMTAFLKCVAWIHGLACGMCSVSLTFTLGSLTNLHKMSSCKLPLQSLDVILWLCVHIIRYLNRRVCNTKSVVVKCSLSSIGSLRSMAKFLVVCGCHATASLHADLGQEQNCVHGCCLSRPMWIRDLPVCGFFLFLLVKNWNSLPSLSLKNLEIVSSCMEHA